MTIILPTEQPAHWLVTGGPETYTGVTHLGECSGIGLGFDAFYGEGELTALEAMMAQAGAFLALPDSGWLEQGDIYQWGGTLVMVRQSHNRAPYNPDETPALFCVYRENAGDVLDWVVGEQVSEGTRRLYESIEYRCLQPHQTQANWTPPATPALWAVVSPGPSPWTPGTYALDALVTHVGRTWKSLMDGNGYEPGQVGSWRDQSDPPLWVQPAGSVGLWHTGDEVEYGAHRWSSTVNNNVWAPGVYGWVDLGAL